MPYFVALRHLERNSLNNLVLFLRRSRVHTGRNPLQRLLHLPARQETDPSDRMRATYLPGPIKCFNGVAHSGVFTSPCPYFRMNSWLKHPKSCPTGWTFESFEAFADTFCTHGSTKEVVIDVHSEGSSE